MAVSLDIRGRSSWESEGGDAERDGGARTLDERGDSVNSRLGGGGLTGDLDARPEWADWCDGR